MADKSTHFQKSMNRSYGMKSLREQYLEIIRKWQAGENTSELAKKFEQISAMLRDAPIAIFDDDVRETVHDINNFLNTETLLRSLSKM
jgi:hypothetical protein